MAKTRPTPPTALAIQGDLDLFSIQAQLERLRPCLAGHQGDLVLDLSAVGDLDLSGVQLLLTLDRHLAARNARLTLTAVKQEWIDRFLPLGLGPLLEGRA